MDNRGVNYDLNLNSTSEEIAASDANFTQFFNVTLKGDYAAGGIGLQNNNTGAITIALPPGSIITNAFLYWYALENKTTLSNTGSLNNVAITGTLISSSSSDPCFLHESTHFFRTDVTKIAASGINTVQINPGGSETLIDGASLVVIFSNPTFARKRIIINDGGLILNGLPLITASTTLTGFIATSPVQARTTYIVGNGQDIVLDNASFNSTLIAGPNAFTGKDGPLWDTLTLDVSSLVNAEDTLATATISIESDCLGWIAQVFSVTEDNEPPIIACPANIVHASNPGKHGAIVNYPPPTVSDNRPGVTTSCSPPSGSFFPIGITRVTCTATDAVGNTTTCSFTITVNDTEQPIDCCDCCDCCCNCCCDSPHDSRRDFLLRFLLRLLFTNFKK